MSSDLNYQSRLIQTLIGLLVWAKSTIHTYSSGGLITQGTPVLARSFLY
ncbi:hypothetical protein F383_35840 [Gossypium arboreum]|uniref:Uncharacterized protein n=1 Tax=Gossypium arboreum TaxID=29729 RepID=A0A0B0N2F1_GOSAR|nr:hypothetical protein F383_35840 [Gossypium arboreum]